VAQISVILEDWKLQEEKEILERFEVLTSRFSHEAAETIGRIQKAAAEQFGFAWKASPLPDRLTRESHFRPGIEVLMTWGLGQFPFLLPKTLFVGYLRKRAHDTCMGELYRHAGRLKSDLGDRLEESVSRYLRALDEHVNAARQSILAALNRAAASQRDEEHKTSDDARRFEAQASLLRRIDDDLASL
jgi:hypothetical protein